ncbi:MAG: hypothetical protein SVM80_01280 [Halobacteriota archaeon]|nr:hypothetical protein [Halobacteriota archaeon]
METRIEPINIIFSVVMAVTAATLTIRWMLLYSKQDALIVVSAIVLVVALAALLININQRLIRIESEIEEKERSLRISVQSVEDSVDKKMSVVVHSINESLSEASKRMYR